MKHQIQAWFQGFIHPFIKDKELKGLSIVLDGRSFDNVKLIECNLYYGGGDWMNLTDCHLDKCTITFFGKAANTLILMKGLAETSENGKDIIRKTFPQLGNNDAA